jgi:hypothetical protein
MDPAQFQGVSLDPVAGWIRLDRTTRRMTDAGNR